MPKQIPDKVSVGQTVSASWLNSLVDYMRYLNEQQQRRRILKGIQSYRAPCGTYRIVRSRTAKSVTSGKEKWRIEKVYELSGPGGWNTTLYS